MDLGIGRSITKALIGAISKPVAATLVSHPELVGPYHKLCHDNGIKHPPTLMLAENWFSVFALPKENQILVGQGYLNMFPPETHLALLAHETGHVLRGDTRISSSDIELPTDRLACQLLGTKEPVVAMVECMNSFPRLPHEEALREKLYGSQEDRLENAKNTDATDRSILDPLIAKHNAYRDTHKGRTRW